MVESSKASAARAVLNERAEVLRTQLADLAGKPLSDSTGISVERAEELVAAVRASRSSR